MPPTEAPTPTPDLGRRRALGFLAGAGLVTLVAACGGESGSTDVAGTTDTTAGSSGSSTTAAAADATTTTAAGTAATASGGAVSVAGAIPEETGGPFPADGTNGPNVLTVDGVVRSDITSSFGDASGVAEGVPLTVELTIVDVATQSALAGSAVYLWHCDRDGSYSQYQDAADANHLRGVQEADADGRLTFRSIFPAAYDGRWPHIHFKIFSALGDATNGRNAIRTTQLALPEDVCDEVYASAAGYESSASNIDRTSLDSDMVFRDGVDLQLATVTGDVTSGYTATLVVGI